LAIIASIADLGYDDDLEVFLQEFADAFADKGAVAGQYDAHRLSLVSAPK